MRNSKQKTENTEPAEEKPVVDAVRALLERDSASGQIVLAKSASVSRTHYAKILGFCVPYLGRAAKSVFDLYDSMLADRLVKKLNMFLALHAKNGTLSFYRGKVSRNWVSRTSKIPLNQLSEPGAKRLLEEYDAQSSKHDSARILLIERFETALESPDVPRVKLEVSKQALAYQIGTTPQRFSREPFASRISQRNAQIKNGELLRPGELISWGTVLSLRTLIPAWPEEVIGKIANDYNSRHGALRSRNRFDALRDALKWIWKSRKEPIKRCFEALKSQRFPTAQDWSALWEAKVKHIKALGLSKSGQKARLNNTTAVFQGLALAGVFPELPFTPRGASQRLIDATTKHHKTLAEVPRPGKQIAAANATDKLIMDILEQKLDKDEFKSHETADFLTVLHQELGEIPASQDIPEAVKQILTKRLNLISQQARKNITEAQANILFGKALLKEAEFDGNSLLEIMSPSSDTEKNAIASRWFPRQINDGNRRRTLANLLSLTMLHFRGAVPSVVTPDAFDIPGVPTSRLTALATALGGRPFVCSLIVPTSSSVVAVTLDYMVASSANPSVARKLGAACMKQGDTAGYVTVTGHKDRAGGKEIPNEFHSNSDIAKNIQWLAEATSQLRDYAPQHLRDRLMLIQVGVSIRALGDGYLRDGLEKLLATIPELAGLPITLGMIRRSVVVREALSSRDASISTAVANHSRKVNQIYNDSYPARLQKEIRIRGYIDSFESRVMVEAWQVAPLEGHLFDDVSSRLDQLESTGLGTICKNRFGKPGNEGRACTEITCAADMCPQMDVRLFPIEVARLQIWKKSLEKAEPAWERDRPEAWFKTWLPFLCLIQVIEDKCSRGAPLASWDAGTEARKAIEASPDYKEPQPW